MDYRMAILKPISKPNNKSKLVIANGMETPIKKAFIKKNHTINFCKMG